MAKKVRHVPSRRCVGCREHGSQAELHRIVRTPQGSVALDVTGKSPGRGAYVHPRPECWENALRPGTIERALHIQRIAPEAGETLRADAIALINGGTPRHEHASEAASGTADPSGKNGGQSRDPTSA